MDLRHYDPTQATDVTEALGESKLDQNRLYELPNGKIVKVKCFWEDTMADQLGSRAVKMTASLCDAQGQALTDAQGQPEISAPHYVRPTINIEGPSLADQVDEARRRWALFHGYATLFWDAPIAGVAEAPAPAPAEVQAMAAADVEALGGPA